MSEPTVTQDFSRYDSAYYTRNIAESRWAGRGMLRPDQCAAVGYLYGIFDLARIHEIAGCPRGSHKVCDPPDEVKVAREQVLDLQLAAMCDASRRRPYDAFDGPIFSGGCGLGKMEFALAQCSEVVTGCDPSPHALRTWPTSGPESLLLVPDTLAEAAAVALPAPDVFMLVEAIEHIPGAEFWAVFDRFLERGLRRLIVTNWRDKHPIVPDGSGWDHITRVDDALYDEIAARGTVRVRNGSHLVVDFKEESGCESDS